MLSLSHQLPNYTHNRICITTSRVFSAWFIVGLVLESCYLQIWLQSKVLLFNFQICSLNKRKFLNTLKDNHISFSKYTIISYKKHHSPYFFSFLRVEVVKASLDLTGKYPNTIKRGIGFLDECNWKISYTSLYREGQLVLLP